MSDMLSQPNALKGLYIGNALWFSSAFIHFAFRQPFIMRKLSLRKVSLEATIRALPTGDAWHHDVLAYLGAMNTSLAALAMIRLYAIAKPSSVFSGGGAKGAVSMDVMAFAVLGLANFSQAFLNFATALKSDRWIMGKGFDRITVLDAVFTVLDWAAAVGRAKML